MPTNVPPQWWKAKEEYEKATTTKKKIEKLEKLISATPKHKGTEKLRAQLKSKLSKLMDKSERPTKGKRKSINIPKEGAGQVSIIGLPNCGKSTFLRKLTNAKPEVADYPYTTVEPKVGMMEYENVLIQLIEIPSTWTPEMLGIARNSDLILGLLNPEEDLNNQKRVLEKVLEDFDNKILWIKRDEKNLKEKIWKALGLIRIYTKTPGKKKEKKPITLKKDSIIKDVAKTVHKDFLKNFKFARMFGPSAKFPGEKVGLEHELKDGDTVELHMR
jgi:ribosome-interacting GTPase 1